VLEKNIIISSIKKTFKILPLKFKKKALISSLLLFLNSFLDLAGLASLLPLFTIILKDNVIHENHYLSEIYTFFEFTSDNQFILFISILVIIIIIGKNIISLIISKFQVTFSTDVMRYGVESLHKIYYKKGYSYFKQTNSNITLRDIYTIPSRFASIIIMGLISLFNEIVILLLILISIFIYDIKIVGLLAITIFPVFYIFYKFTKNKIKFIGDETNRIGPEISKNIFQSIFGYVDVIMTGTKDYFFKTVKILIKPLAKLNVKRTVYNLAPTKVIESAMVISIIIILIYGIYFLPSKEEVLSLLGLYALAAYRIMPSINRIMIAINGITENQFTFDVIEELRLADTQGNFVNNKKVPFNKELKLKNITFKYPDGKNSILKDYSLTIKRGEIIGIRGRSGGGKTTLMNIMLGLLEPDSGTFLVDDIVINKENVDAWQKHIGYVQQEVYLLDATLAENIAFGINKKDINFDKIEEVIEKASLKDFVNTLAHGINTKVGERGAQISGGQRQRVGIARALYFNSDVLFFDEATSALDPQTEKEITESINKLSKQGLTMIIIAHRETSLEGADKIIEINNGPII